MTMLDERPGENTIVLAPAAPLAAIASVILSTTLIAIGNGLLFAYIPVRLGAEGFPPAWAGIILTGLSAGGIVGCFLTGRIVRRVGHARAYMLFSALIILANAAISAGTYPFLWTASRALYGFAICGLFIVAQSWLNDAVANAIRGRVMAIFYICYIVGLGLGSLALSFIEIDTTAAPIIAIVFAALSIIPVGLTSLRPPPPPEVASIALSAAWGVSPVGIAGMLAVGGLSMMVAGFAPIYATASGFSKNEVSLLMLSMQLGTIMVQLPFGWLSDRTDRRYVLVAASALVTTAGIVASQTIGAPFPLVVLVFMIWSGATESIYSIANAHAGDRATKEDLVALSSTMLFAWSLSGFLIQGAATALTAAFGTEAFMYVAILVAALFCGFVLWRLTQATPPDTAASFAPMSAQAPLAAELAFPQDETPGND
ncbi:MFS transporter [Mesorhizobium sp. 1B3]|uniref:MFS transporter n=1 Tax=Mesorhizobium sp. 1B3 TaxID=3243599 RepID=UPI003D961DC7